MKVFLIHFSYHKSKWSGRANWPSRLIYAESISGARDKFLLECSRGCGLRIDSIEDVTGKPHKRSTFTYF